MLGQPNGIAGSYWQRGRARNPVALPLAGDIKVDVAVIGGGYTGLSAAYHLKTTDPGLEVAVLEAERRATVPAGATPASS